MCIFMLVDGEYGNILDGWVMLWSWQEINTQKRQLKVELASLECGSA